MNFISMEIAALLIGTLVLSVSMIPVRLDSQNVEKSGSTTDYIFYTYETDPCMPDNTKGRNTVEFFLTASHLEKLRIQSGTDDISTDQIQHIDNEEVCQDLNKLVSSNTELQHSIDGWTRYYYKAGNFYFIFYRSDNARMGYSPFIVLDSQYNITGNFAI